MSEVNKPSHNEQARADAIKAQQNKAKHQQSKTTATQKGAQHQVQGQPTEKKLKSAFDNVLDSLAEGPSAPLMPSEASKFDAKLQEIRHDDDRNSSEDSGEEEDHKTKEKGEKTQTQRQGATGVKGRVASKRGSQGQGQGSSSGEDKGGQSQDKMAAKQMQAHQIKQEQMKPQFTPAPSPVFGATPLGQVQAPEAPAAPREIPKAVLDQIVQSVTITRSKEFVKEIKIDFQDNFFNGLSLRVTAKGNEISVQFLVQNRDLEATFKNEKDKIAAALGEKNIDVRSIEVTLRS